MQKLLVSVLLSFSLVFSGCAAFNTSIPTKTPVEQQTPQQKLESILRNVDGGIIAADRTLVAKVKAGTLDFQTGLEYHTKLVAAGAAADKVKEFLDVGDLTNAQVQLNLAQQGLSFVEAYLAKIAQENK